MKVSTELLCLKATIDVRLQHEKYEYVTLLLTPVQAKELSKFIQDLATIEYSIEHSEKED
jgi:hypothetical protein